MREVVGLLVGEAVVGVVVEQPAVPLEPARQRRGVRVRVQQLLRKGRRARVGRAGEGEGEGGEGREREAARTSC